MAYTTGSISNLRKKMADLGVKEGGNLRPDSASMSPDRHEIDVIFQAKQFIESEQSARTDIFVDAEKKISEIDQKIESIEASCNSNLDHDLLESAFQSALSNEESALINFCAKELEARAALSSYKIRNGLNDPAHYPQDQLYHFSLLIMFIVIETVVNAFFYQGSSGLLGGAVVALSVSLVNMSISAALGATYRYTNLATTKDKLIGYSAGISFLISVVVLNLIFSTFRIQYELLQQEIIQLNLAEPSTTMLVTAFKTAVGDAFRVFLFELPDIDVMSFVLFFVGLICSFIAFWKGYTFDDKHPGYGEMDRRHKVVEKLYITAKERAYNTAVQKVTSIADEVDELRKTLISSQRNSHALKAQIQSAQFSFDANIRKIQSELNLAIEAYRGANQVTRATKPPIYFNTLPNILPAESNQKLDELMKAVEHLAIKSKEIADDKVSLLSDKLQQIRGRIHKLVQDEFQKYLTEINNKATIVLRAHGQVQNLENK